MTEIKLELVDYTYAETANGEIRIHKDLHDYNPKLYWHALKHELGHQDTTFWQDLVWDLKDIFHIRLHFMALGFYIRHPKLMWRMLNPINIRKETVSVDAVNGTIKERTVIEVNFVSLTLYLLEFMVIFLLLMVMLK